MKIGVLGTGNVGKTIGTRLLEFGHEVKMGSRTPNNEKAVDWVKNSVGMSSNGTFSDSASFGEILFNCTNGGGSLDALKLAGEENLNGKILIDVSNPLDFSKGNPPSLFVCNTDSLGEQIQKSFPLAKVVKTLNTMNCRYMVDPKALAGGEHDNFICGDDNEAKGQVIKILNQFGWKNENVIDLGDITQARGPEQVLPIWIRMYGIFGNVNFNFKIVRG